MKIAMFPNPSGSRYWRMEDPGYFLKKRGHQVEIVDSGVTDDVAKWADLYVVSGGVIDKNSIALLYSYQQELGKKIVVDQDDWIEVSDDNPHKREHEIYDALETVKVTLKIANVVTTTNKFLASKLKAYNKNVKILPNYLNMTRWDLEKQKNQSEKLRIGWAGSITHYKDIEYIAPVIKKILSTFKNTQFVACGDLRIQKMFKGYDVEVVNGVPFEVWPTKLHGLRLDVGVAPLIKNDFNKCKSNIKYLEYAIANIPSVYSGVVYGVKNFDIRKRGLIARSKSEWYACLRNLVTSKVLREDVIDSSYAHVSQQFDLSKQIGLWEKVYESVLS